MQGRRGQQPLGQARRDTGEGQEQRRERDVEPEVEEHHLLVHRRHVLLQQHVGVGQQRNRDQRADRLEQQVAQRQAARPRRGAAGGHQRQQPAAHVGSQHEAQRDAGGQQARGGHGGGEQHDREAGVRRHGEHGAHDDVERRLVRQRDQQCPHGRRCGQRLRRGHDELQGQRDEAART